MNAAARIALTAGEPAGIGPDLIIKLAQQPQDAVLVVIADPGLLTERARLLGLPLTLIDYASSDVIRPSAPGELYICPEILAAPCTPGVTDPRNASYVINTLIKATDGCLQDKFDAMLTAPVHKAVINDAGIAFSGHTGFLAEHCKSPQPVMLLCAGDFRVALLTTHLSLRDVPDQITEERLEGVIRVLHQDLLRLFSLQSPRIAVLGLNPHAGEDGHLGREEIEIIDPTLERLRDMGFDLSGPLPADSAFTEEVLNEHDAILAMYHDQGLPVIKHAGFHQAVNVTLGLPIIRTSVDHGTALELAGTGKGHCGSLIAALELTKQFLARRMA